MNLLHTQCPFTSRNSEYHRIDIMAAVFIGDADEDHDHGMGVCEERNRLFDVNRRNRSRLASIPSSGQKGRRQQRFKRADGISVEQPLPIVFDGQHGWCKERMADGKWHIAGMSPPSLFVL